MAPLRVQYKCREWKLRSIDLSLPAHAGWMDHWAASQSHIFRRVLCLQGSWFQLSTLYIVLCQTSAVVHVLLPLVAHFPVLHSKLSCYILNLWVSYSQTLQIWYSKLANQTFRTKSCSVWKSCLEAVPEPAEKQLPWARSLLPAGRFKPRPKWCLMLRNHIGNNKQLPGAGVHKIQDSLSSDIWTSSTSW